MKRWPGPACLWENLGLWVGGVCLILFGILVGTGVGLTSTVWTGSTSITSPFYTAWTHHPGCGKHTSGIKRGYYGNYRQTFAHCSMTFSTVYVTHFGTPTATPRPTRIPSASPEPSSPTPTATIAPVSTASPVATHTVPAPAPTATDTAIPPTPQPIPTAVPANDPATYELSLMNAARAQYGLPPYSLNLTQSNGTATCAGSIGHSLAMQAAGAIFHSDPRYPSQSFPNNLCVFGLRGAGENVGYAYGQSINGSLDSMEAQMIVEPHTPGCQGNHACSILSPSYTQVGIGIVQAGGFVYLTVDFLQF